MSRIQALPEDVQRRIAAGEVIERPASVVKELLENALDAGATALSVRTAGAGVRRIEVTDNGSGMSPEDLRRAPLNFTTSKIRSADDLWRVSTYGFRGEALASVSAVSRFEITSSDTTSGEGWRVRIEGKGILEGAPAPHERGTTVRVDDLFFNTPARRKFLKSETTERKRILEVVLAVALALPGVELHYSDDDKPVLDLVPAANWRDRLTEVLGASTMRHMVEASISDGPMRAHGFVSLPTHTRANRSQQFFFINGRSVREKNVSYAVQDAYRAVIPHKRFPVVVLSLQVPCEDVDVNVHPNKLEVRLRHERHVFDVVRRAVKTALSPSAEHAQAVGYRTNDGIEGDAQVAWTATQPAGPGGDVIHRVEARGYRERVRDAVASYLENQTARRGSAQGPPTTEIRESSSDPPVESLKDKVGREDALFWQFNNAYIFIQVRGGIVVIDQHAAHERVIFDRSKKRLANEIPVSQQILFPIPLELSLAELEVFRSSSEIFAKLGFHLEPFGGKSIIVRGYPQGVSNWEEGRLLREMFDDILQERAPGETHSDRIIASFACRSAVRAGQKLGVDEMKMLADELFAVENPYSCPHGRPTIQRISVEEIESWFLRR